MIRDKLATFCSFGLFAGWASLTMAASPQQERTASWYAAHPTILENVIKLCRDDPGQAVRNPDCMNASQAQVLIALRDTDNRNSGNLTPPSDPRYWQIHPGELPLQLAICDRLSPEAQAANWCQSAYAATGRSQK
jgi:hypothetical protein